MPDLLITDLSMPEPDGFDLLISERPKFPSLPILVVSGMKTAHAGRRQICRRRRDTGEAGLGRGAGGEGSIRFGKMKRPAGQTWKIVFFAIFAPLREVCI